MDETRAGVLRWVSADFLGGPRAGATDRYLTTGPAPDAIAVADPGAGIYVLVGPSDDPDPDAYVYRWQGQVPELPAARGRLRR